jgi:hypothetical protein
LRCVSSVAAGRAWAPESMLSTVGEIAGDGAVLVVEDAHWADASTVDVLAFLGRTCPCRFAGVADLA